MSAPFGTIALGESLRRLSVVIVTIQVLLGTRGHGGTTINKWRSRSQFCHQLLRRTSADTIAIKAVVQDWHYCGNYS